MKITDIEVTELRIPGWKGESFDGSYDKCVVQVHTDAGITGFAVSAFLSIADEKFQHPIWRYGPIPTVARSTIPGLPHGASPIG
jgi:hypothetical protein